MELSVIVPTLNRRERLASCLDALSDRVPSGVELIVVNGPSSDGTSGAVRERADVDVLVEISERNRNVARNAGFETATGDVVAFLADTRVVEPSWYDAVETAVGNGADVVTGPGGDPAHDPKRSRSIAGRTVTCIDADNVAFDRPVLEALDGFDEYLADGVGGACDCAHRIAGLSFDVTWAPGMAVREAVGTDGGLDGVDPGEAYRSLAYRLAKSYGPRPAVLARTVGSAASDGLANARAVAADDARPSEWLANGAAVARNVVRGLADGLGARYRDRDPRRNPNGVSTRHDRAVRLYDRR